LKVCKALGDPKSRCWMGLGDSDVWIEVPNSYFHPWTRRVKVVLKVRKLKWIIIMSVGIKYCSTGRYTVDIK
jgi:hypothetical protein